MRVRQIEKKGFFPMLMQTPKGTRSGRDAPRILFYSHDTFGLGHIRRTRTIAMALAQANPGASILIVTGSPIVGRFDFPHGVDFVRIPGVVKLPSGDYVTHNMGLDIAETVKLRRAIIRQTARVFDPDLVIVDKEPTGFRGEMLHTLKKMRERGAHVVLGVRDVLDDPEALRAEWKRKKAVEAVETFYDEIWVYGLEAIYDPLQGLPLSEDMLECVRYTGYLRREPADWPTPQFPSQRGDYVLVTPGGGGDGDALVDWTLSAYEADPTLTIPAVIVFGPFMNPESRREFEKRAHRYRTIETISFDARLERLMIDATGVIAMGGYNTFCEILSFDKPAAIAPRVTPRKEQFIRAEAAERMGLINMLPPANSGDGQRDPAVMADAIRALTKQAPPSKAKVPGLLDGLDRVVDLAEVALEGVR